MDDEAAGAYTIGASKVLMQYEYHVLYSLSHQVPVLYFRASTLGMISLYTDIFGGMGLRLLK